jgi:hypothetical protein
LNYCKTSHNPRLEKRAIEQSNEKGFGALLRSGVLRKTLLESELCKVKQLKTSEWIKILV